MTGEVLRYWGPLPDREVCGDCGADMPQQHLTHDETGPVCANQQACDRRRSASGYGRPA